MFMVMYTTLWLLSSQGLFLLGFLTGRAARKLPIIDRTLPWTLHWGEILPSTEQGRAKPDDDSDAQPR
jgi:hypothetical protein